MLRVIHESRTKATDLLTRRHGAEGDLGETATREGAIGDATDGEAGLGTDKRHYTLEEKGRGSREGYFGGLLRPRTMG